MKKFSSQMNDQAYLDLQKFCELSGMEFSVMLEEAVKDMLIKYRLRPACRKAAEDIIRQYDSALKELA